MTNTVKKFNINPRALAHALIAEDIEQNGAKYYLCANCGQPYILGQMGDSEAEDWQDTTVCSPRCFNSYLNYLNNP